MPFFLLSQLLQVQAEASATSKELMALIEKLKAEVITSRMTEIQNKESHELEVNTIIKVVFFFFLPPLISYL